MVDHGVYSFENGVTVTLNGLPPAPVAWLYNTVDLLCMPLGCTAWRSHLHVSEDSWLADQYRVPWITSHTPSLLTYADFRQQEIVPGESWLTWNSVYRFAFETPSTSLGDLSTPTAFAVLCILAFALGKIKSVLVPYFSCWGLKAAIHTHGDKWAKANETRIVKFGEYIFRLLYHSIISIYGIWYFRDKQWWKPGEAISVFQGYPHHEIMPGMAWYYLLQSAYNLDAFLSLMYLSFACKFQSIRRARSSKRRSSQWQSPFAISWRPDVRGDFQEMFVHHVTTNLLVFGSSVLRFTRIGSMVFLVHDVSDVPVDLSKLANFLQWKVATVFCFGTMSLTWLYTRLYILPVKIYWTMLTKSHYVLAHGGPVLCYVCYRHFFYFFLSILIALHAAWFLMFMRMFHTLLVKYECHDYSEHKNGEQVNVPESSRNGLNGKKDR